MSVRSCQIGFRWPSRPYDAALVSSVTSKITARVQDIRSRLRGNVAHGAKLPPHITLLYLGIMKGPELERFAADCGKFAGRVCEAVIIGLDCFQEGGRIINLHIRLSSMKLRDLHFELFDLAVNRGLSPDKTHALDRYQPHISIVDQIDAGPEEIAGLLALAMPPDVFSAGDLHFLAEGDFS